MKFLKYSRLFAIILIYAIAQGTVVFAFEVKDAPRKLGLAHQVVVLVWDGLRPDLMSAQNTPILFQMAHQGVFFAHNHPVYVSSTEVNATALATGLYPENSGLIGNKEYRPDLEWHGPIGTESLEAIRQADRSLSRYLRGPTLAEMLQARGDKTLIAGTKTVALLADRSARPMDFIMGLVLFAGQSLPETFSQDLQQALGPFPPQIEFPNLKQDLWTTKALLWQWQRGGMPVFSLLWLSDPDFSQHNTAPGETSALAAIKSDDDNLGRVLQSLEDKGLRRETDVLVVSDHGFSTIEQVSDLVALLKTEGFRATRKFLFTPTNGEVLVVGNGGSLFLYVIGHQPEIIQKLVDFLQRSEIAGVIFTKKPLRGTFLLHQALINSPDAPDLAVSLRWTNHANKYGIPGSIVSDVGRAVGQGMHATLSPFDLHNTLIANGPDFKVGFVDPLPSGNVDVAPTLAAILGLTPFRPFDGRVLTEALTSAPAQPLSVDPEQVEASVPIGTKTWHQYLRSVRVGETTYLEEGNGAAR